jgi:hypothetical protein
MGIGGMFQMVTRWDGSGVGVDGGVGLGVVVRGVVGECFQVCGFIDYGLKVGEGMGVFCR